MRMFDPVPVTWSSRAAKPSPASSRTVPDPPATPNRSAAAGMVHPPPPPAFPHPPDIDRPKSSWAITPPTVVMGLELVGLGLGVGVGVGDGARVGVEVVGVADGAGAGSDAAPVDHAPSRVLPAGRPMTAATSLG